MTEEQFARSMQGFIDQRDREIARLKGLIDDRTNYIRGLENDYSRQGLERQRYKNALQKIVRLGLGAGQIDLVRTAESALNESDG